MDTSTWIALFSLILTIATGVGGAVLWWIIRTDKTLTALTVEVKHIKESTDQEHGVMWSHINKNRDSINILTADVAVLKSQRNKHE